MKHTVEHNSNSLIETAVVGNTINQEKPFCIHGHMNVKIYCTHWYDSKYFYDKCVLYATEFDLSNQN